jgi:feruloyl-CoA synthase
MPPDMAAAPFRDPRFAPLRLETERRADGTVVIRNVAPVPAPFATMAEPLEHWARATPDRIWLAERPAPGAEGWRTLSFAEGAARVRRLAKGFAELGLGPGRPLLILSRNGIDHAVAAYAALRIGCPISPVSPQYGLPGADPARLAHALALVQPFAAFTEEGAVFGPALQAAEGLAGKPLIAARNAGGRLLDMASLESGGEAPAAAQPGDIAKLLLTSGSTAKPKAVVLTQANLVANAAQVTACFDDPEPPVLVNAAPWSHSLGANAILHMLLHRGGTLYIDQGQPVPGRFGETVRNLREVATTYHNAVPAGWALLADALETDEALAATFFSRVRLVQYGGAGLPQSVADRVERAAVRACGERISWGSGYGSTETGPTLSNVSFVNDRAGLSGLPVPGTAVKLSPAPGGKFELCGRGPQISPGYRQPDGSVTPLNLDAEGFFPLGDAARLADDARPELGLVFDGRLVENFKLATGAFVATGALRLQALSAIGGAAADAVVCGEGEAGVGLLLFLNRAALADIPGADLAQPHLCPAVRAHVAAGLARLNGSAGGIGGRVARALILADAPDAASGELTDKGYLNQALARARRPAEIARLFAAAPDAAVIVL